MSLYEAIIIFAYSAAHVLSGRIWYDKYKDEDDRHEMDLIV